MPRGASSGAWRSADDWLRPNRASRRARDRQWPPFGSVHLRVMGQPARVSTRLLPCQGARPTSGPPALRRRRLVSSSCQSRRARFLRRLRTGWRLRTSAYPPPPTSRNIALTRSSALPPNPANDDAVSRRDGFVSAGVDKAPSRHARRCARTSSSRSTVSVLTSAGAAASQAAPMARKPRSKSSSSGEAEKNSVRRTVNVGSAGSTDGPPGFSKKIAHGNASTRAPRNRATS